MAAPKDPRRVASEDLLLFHLVSDPQISPDGHAVLFTKKHAGEKNEYVTDLWQVPAAGGDARPLTRSGKDRQGRWSPDSTRIAFVSARARPLTQVYVLALAGGEAAPLTRFAEGAVGEIKWSP